MPRPLNSTDNFETIKNWLDGTLTDTNSFIPNRDAIHQVLSKGIYFWFMKPAGYQKLSNYLPIQALPTKYSRTINGEQFDLVYLGTAGVRDTGKGNNKGHLLERFEWHILNYQNQNHVCSGIMSTFRRTLIPLFSEDLILNNAQSELNTIFSKYFKLYYLPYPGSFTEVKDRVNKDESILINVIKPIFNIKSNQNAKTLGHITFQIKKRRNEIEKITKTRLACKK